MAGKPKVDLDSRELAEKVSNVVCSSPSMEEAAAKLGWPRGTLIGRIVIMKRTNKDLVFEPSAEAAEQRKTFPITEESAEVFAKNDIRYLSNNAAAEAMGIHFRTYWEVKKRLQDKFPEIFQRRYSVKFEDLSSRRCFIIATAQNNTAVHERFWNNLKVYARYKRATLIVISTTYNVNNVFNNRKRGSNPVPQETEWAKEVQPYLNDNRVKLADGLVMCGEMQILPTAVDPLSGLASYSQMDSAIFPHTKHAVRSYPASLDKTKMLFTTGAVTERNHIPAKAGLKAEFHHIFGACIVDVNRKGKWQVRHINADEHGDFYDLHNSVSNGEIEQRRDAIAALNLGDVHYGKLMWHGKHRKMMWDVIEKLKPRSVFLHDLFDGSSISPHLLKDKLRARQASKEETSAVAELRGIADFINELSRRNIKPYIVYSNHDHWLYRWLLWADWRIMSDEDALLYLALAKESIKRGKDFHALSCAYHYVRPEMNPAYSPVFLDANESFIKNDIEFGMHGHYGINGSKGTPSSFKNMGTKVNIGHTHSAGVWDAVFCAGTCTPKRLGYNQGPSSWSVSHIVTYLNGKRTLYPVEL